MRSYQEARYNGAVSGSGCPVQREKKTCETSIIVLKREREVGGCAEDFQTEDETVEERITTVQHDRIWVGKIASCSRAGKDREGKRREKRRGKREA